jgi:polysaccharide deacetylase family protein (PEP-CTERM system associated)
MATRKEVAGGEQTPAEPVRNAMTVDVEDYFHVTAFEKCIQRSQWDGIPLRVEGNTLRALDLFDRFGVRATFFVLGWVAERLPSLAREIARRGHEIACHGYGHALVYGQSPQEFREDVHRAKSLLEDQTGGPVRGYRAPSYSITARSIWALDILVSEGFLYDSSIFPIHHDIYGMPGAQRFPHRMKCQAGELCEFPISTTSLEVLGRRLCIPIAGGGYLRLLPIWAVESAIRRINLREKQPAVVYFHPWELDPGQPRIRQAPLKSRFRHYVNLHKTEGKLQRLLGAFRFGPMSEVLGLPL